MLNQKDQQKLIWEILITQSYIESMIFQTEESLADGPILSDGLTTAKMMNMFFDSLIAFVMI